jgi:REP element-mobilizing transposase RayT
MPESYSELYIHGVWTTMDRLPLLDKEIKPEVYNTIQDQCRKLNAEVVALDGTEDHLHLLVQIPPALSVAALAQHVKGASSHLVRRTIGRGEFQWQEGYGAFTVSRWDVKKVQQYIEHQAQHHSEHTVKRILEPR